MGVLQGDLWGPTGEPRGSYTQAQGTSSTSSTSSSTSNDKMKQVFPRWRLLRNSHTGTPDNDTISLSRVIPAPPGSIWIKLRPLIRKHHGECFRGKT